MAEEGKRSRSAFVGVAGVIAVIGLLIAGVLTIDFQPNLSRLDVSILSGSNQGQYFATVERLKASAARSKGRIENVSTQGSVDNIERLQRGRAACDAHFAIVQDGSPWEASEGLELIAQLPSAETLFFLGKDADRMGRLSDLDHLRVGIGPKGSGTARLVRQNPRHAGIRERGGRSLEPSLERAARDGRAG